MVFLRCRPSCRLETPSFLAWPFNSGCCFCSWFCVSSGSHRIGTLNPTLLTASIPHFLSVWPWLVCPGRSRRSRSRCGSQGQTRGSHHRGLRNLDRIRTGLPGLGNGVKWQHFMMLSTSSASDRCESQGRCGLTGAVRSIEPTRLSSYFTLHLHTSSLHRSLGRIRHERHSDLYPIRSFFTSASIQPSASAHPCRLPNLHLLAVRNRCI
jgi:hypothetical protein